MLTAAQPATSVPPSPQETTAAVSLFTVFAFLSVLIILMLVLIIGIRRKNRRLHGERRPAPRTRHIDAWAEAGSRMQPPDDLDDLIAPAPPDPDGNFGPGKRQPPGKRGNWNSGKDRGEPL